MENAKRQTTYMHCTYLLPCVEFNSYVSDVTASWINAECQVCTVGSILISTQEYNFVPRLYILGHPNINFNRIFVTFYVFSIRGLLQLANV